MDSFNANKASPDKRQSLTELVQVSLQPSRHTAPQITKSFQRVKDNLVRDTVQYSTQSFDIAFTRYVRLKDNQDFPMDDAQPAQIFYAEAHFSKYDSKTKRIYATNYILEKQKNGTFIIYSAVPRPAKSKGYTAWVKKASVAQRNNLAQSLQFLKSVNITSY